MKLLVNLCLLFVGLGFATIGWPATKPVDWATVTSGAEVSAALTFFEDTSNSLAIDEIQTRVDQFQSLQGPRQFSRSRSSFWFRLEVMNSSDEKLEKLIVLKYPSHHQILFVETGQRGIERVLERNAKRMVNEVDVQHRMPVYAVALQARELKTIYIKLASPTIRMNLEVWDIKEFMANGRSSEWWFLVFLGVIVAATLYAAVIAIASRSSLYGSLLLITVLMLFAQITQHGHAYQILGGVGGLFNYAWLLQQCWTSAAVLLFSYIFLGGSRLDTLSRYSIISLALGFAAAGFYSLFDYHGALLPARPLLALGPILLFAIVIYQVVRKNRDALLFLLAWAPLLFLTILVGLGGFGVLGVASLGSSLVSAWIPTTVLVFAFCVIFRTRVEYQESMGKSTFLAVLSHEVRTPLTAIIGTVSLLSHSPLNARQKNLVGSLKESSHSLLTLLDDVLQMSRFEAGKPVELELVATNPAELTDNLIALMSARAESKGLDIQCAVTGDVPRAVLVDEARLRQVLLNLLSNSLKFTEHGSVSLNLAGERLASDRVKLSFSVSDQGIGIPGEQVANLFKPYTQASGDRQQGTGLGLFISQQLVQLMGGEISVETETGVGSTFAFAIEAELTNEEPIRSSSDDQQFDTSRASGKRLLLVDDVALNREVLGEQLKNAGFQVQLAESGEQALAVVATSRFDVLVLDVFMPGLTGLQVAERLRGQGELTPILGLTAAAEPELIQKCLVSGMNRVLRKPTLIHVLARTLVELIDEVGTRRALPILNPNALTDLANLLGAERCQELKQSAEKSLVKSVKELKTAMANNQWSRVSQLSHQISGVAANVGLEKLSEAAEALAAELRNQPETERGKVEQRSDLDELLDLCDKSLVALKEG